MTSLYWDAPQLLSQKYLIITYCMIIRRHSTGASATFSNLLITTILRDSTSNTCHIIMMVADMLAPNRAQAISSHNNDDFIGCCNTIWLLWHSSQQVVSCYGSHWKTLERSAAHASLCYWQVFVLIRIMLCVTCILWFSLWTQIFGLVAHIWRLTQAFIIQG